MEDPQGGVRHVHRANIIRKCIGEEFLELAQYEARQNKKKQLNKQKEKQMAKAGDLIQLMQKHKQKASLVQSKY